VLYIYDALYKQDTIQHVLVRHEQAAVHAADGYARATGEVGVALVTSGPASPTRHRHRHRLHGLDPDGDHHRPGADAAIGRTPSRNATPSASRARCVKHNFLVKDVRDIWPDDEEGLPHRPHRPPRARWWSTSPRTCR
jgi:acetolactate synthase-1/2/3 large subunit